MSETITAEKEIVLEEYNRANGKRKVCLERIFGMETFQKNIKERIKTIDDIYALNGTTIEKFEAKWKGFASHEIGNAFEVLIVAAYNEGKLPNWKDGKVKIYPLFNMPDPSGVGFSCFGYGGWNSVSHVGSRLVFHGPDALENMRDAVKKFLPEYQKSRTT